MKKILILSSFKPEPTWHASLHNTAETLADVEENCRKVAAEYGYDAITKQYRAAN
ncbi:hypothetical protein OH492_13395 [Vibrio chagasii]|nr:hypothetical protein [Vibrio chagasii]